LTGPHSLGWALAVDVEPTWPVGPWPAAWLWLGLALTDELLRSLAARAYQAGARRHFRNADPLRKRGTYGLVFAFLFKAWACFLFLQVMAAVALGQKRPWLFELVAGAFVLTEATFVLRRAQAYWTYRFACEPGQLRGAIAYSWKLTLRLGALGSLGYAALYALLYWLYRHLFVAGGALGCVFMAFYWWSYSLRAAPKPPAPAARQP